MKQLLFKYESPHDDTENFTSALQLPKKVEIRGVENFINFTKATSKASPDLIFDFHNTTIRNNGIACSVTTNFTFNGTPLYNILMMTPEKNNNKNKRNIKKRKFNEDVKKEDNIVNLTDLSEKSDFLDLSKLLTNDESQDIYYFEHGPLLKNISTYCGQGSATIHINKENKIYLFEYTVSSREMISKYRI